MQLAPIGPNWPELARIGPFRSVWFRFGPNWPVSARFGPKMFPRYNTGINPTGIPESVRADDDQSCQTSEV